MLVALSFDDGPNNTITPKMLDILEEHGVPASFFVIGQYINDSSAKQMQRAVARLRDPEPFIYAYIHDSALYRKLQGRNKAHR